MLFFISFLLVLIGFKAGIIYKNEMFDRRLNIVLRFDRDTFLWREVYNTETLLMDENIIIGMKFVAPEKTTVEL